MLAEGHARLDLAVVPEGMTRLFAAKYAVMLATSLEQWRSTFSTPVLVTVTRIVAWTRRDGELRYRSVP